MDKKGCVESLLEGKIKNSLTNRRAPERSFRASRQSKYAR